MRSASAINRERQEKMKTQGWPNSKSKPVNGGSEDGDGKDGGGIVVAIVTKKITGIIANDYRNNLRRYCRQRRARPPIQKEGAGPKALPDEEERGPQSKGGGRPSRWWWDGDFVEGFDGGGMFGEGKGKVDALVELLELWWLLWWWRWRRSWWRLRLW